jgi:hypothetical protein
VSATKNVSPDAKCAFQYCESIQINASVS